MQHRQHPLHVGRPVLGAPNNGCEVDILHSRDLHRPDSSTLLKHSLPYLGPALTRMCLRNSTLAGGGCHSCRCGSFERTMVCHDGLPHTLRKSSCTFQASKSLTCTCRVCLTSVLTRLRSERCGRLAATRACEARSCSLGPHQPATPIAHTHLPSLMYDSSAHHLLLLAAH